MHNCEQKKKVKKKGNTGLGRVDLRVELKKNERMFLSRADWKKQRLSLFRSKGDAEENKNKKHRLPSKVRLLRTRIKMTPSALTGSSTTCQINKQSTVVMWVFHQWLLTSKDWLVPALTALELNDSDGVGLGWIGLDRAHHPSVQASPASLFIKIIKPKETALASLASLSCPHSVSKWRKTKSITEPSSLKWRKGWRAGKGRR
jgi:hypothetical protein